MAADLHIYEHEINVCCKPLRLGGGVIVVVIEGINMCFYLQCMNVRFPTYPCHTMNYQKA